MQLRKGEAVDVDIEKLAFGGAGIGRCRCAKEPQADGMVTFVPNTLPGDRVKASLLKIKKNRLEGRLERLVKPSSLRIPPRCAHFEECGGCVWQHLAYENQLTFKEEQVREALQHLGGFSEKDVDRVVRPIIGCKEPWAYRNKMEFSFDSPMEDAEADGTNLAQVMLGLHLPKKHHDVFDLEECHLCSSIASEIVRAVRAFARDEGLDAFRDRTGDGLLRHLVVREGKNTGEVMVNLVTSVNSFPGVERFVELFGADEWKDRITSLIWTTIMQQRGTPTWRESKVLAGRGVIYEELRLETGQRLRFEVSPESFFQPNTKQAEILYGEALKCAGLTGKEVVYDLYCGTGTIGLFCAHKAKHVYGIELSKAAVENARKNALRNDIENAEFFVGDVGKVMADHSLPQPDVVIVDPPRAGLEGDVPNQVAALKAPKIVYVSCNPATLTRDLKFFTDQGYTLESVQPVDMFPHTYHIEDVALLSYPKS